MIHNSKTGQTDSIISKPNISSINNSNKQTNINLSSLLYPPVQNQWNLKKSLN